MKTLEEFIRRLQDDAAFEKQAQSFDRGEDLMAFVKSEGYDFTLEQLMGEFRPEEKLPAGTDGLAPASADISAAIPPRPDEAELPSQPGAFANGERGTALLKRGNDDFTREQPLERLPQPKEAMPPPEPEAEPLAGLFKGGGGRHRGFSLQRLKSISGEDP